MSSILLINPPSPFLTYPNAAPHIGLGYLISYLQKHFIKVSYLNLENDLPEEIVIPEGYDYYGISSVSAQYHYAKLLLTQIKNRKLGKSIIGGAHPSVMPDMCYSDGFDFVVKGYGEEILLDILSGDVKKGIHQGRFIEQLDLLPFPSWEHLFESNYNISYGNNVAHIFSMRGCPYTCSYCSSADIFGTRVGFRGIQNVVDEINYLKEKYKIQKLYFLDPTFTINRKRTIKLCDFLKELNVEWTCETRVDKIDEELLNIMQNAGCNLLSLGIETGAASTHYKLSKNTSIEQNKTAIKMAHNAGLKVKAFLMGALPYDNRKSIEEFKEFLINNKPDTWLYSTFIPFPGTEQWKNPDKYCINIVNKDFRGYYNLGLNGRGPINITTELLSRDDLKELRDDMLYFLLKEIPNPRVDYAIEQFDNQRKRLIPYLSDIDYKYFF
jgi:anaerobic magnesium-protoporphyrin IX monomethyl ester cyclase